MRLTRPMLLLILALTVAACGALREPEEPSAPIEAIPLAVATAPAVTGTAADSPTTDQAVAEAETVVEPAPSAAGELLIYRISQEESRVRFELGEDLRGVRTAVVGLTDQVAGEIAVNLSDLTSAQVGIIQINARGLATDNNFRNRAIHNDILNTGTYEFITFSPTALVGLPAAAAPGDEVSFTIDGDLTIRDITRPVTFDVTATAVAADRLVGTATASVDRASFDLRIPSVPSVANVDEVVRLTIDFVAEAMS
jgi:polyisoprenoid-binding protein YceI